MITFDLILLISTSALLGAKNLYLGMVTLVIGLLITFQNMRTVRLLGNQEIPASASRKVKAAILALVIGLCALPLVIEGQMTAVPKAETPMNQASVLPLVVMIGLFAASLMAALAIEKRKR